jgi:hypothetical protein
MAIVKESNSVSTTDQIVVQSAKCKLHNDTMLHNAQHLFSVAWRCASATSEKTILHNDMLLKRKGNAKCNMVSPYGREMYVASLPLSRQSDWRQNATFLPIFKLPRNRASNPGLVTPQRSR